MAAHRALWFWTLLLLVLTLFLSVANLGSSATRATTEDCWNWDGLDDCSGSQVDNPPEMEQRRWQTPADQKDPSYVPSYQNFNKIVGYARVTYSRDLMQAMVQVITFQKNNQYKLLYKYGSYGPSSDDVFKTSKSANNGNQLNVEVLDAADPSQVLLRLEPIDFIFDNVPVNNSNPAYENGQKGAIVELFGWPYDDIAEECEDIAKMGWMGVKVFPPQESVFAFDQPQNGDLNPWYYIYQPVSYKLNSRSGTRAQLKRMINKCRSVGVRVYVDAVINHMQALGNDVQWHRQGGSAWCTKWGPHNSTSGSPYYGTGFTFLNNTYTHSRPAQENPAVPYGPLDFHCQRPIRSWSSPLDLNYGWLVGLADLNTEHDYVQQRIADYLTELLSIGFSGVRIDAAKHISPDGLAAIFAKMKSNLGGSIPQDFIAYLEVLLGGEKDLLMCNDNPYQYSNYFTNVMKSAGLSDDDIFKIKIWSSDYPKEFPICGWWIIPSERLAIENDCHDDQHPGSSSRDMGDKGSVLVIEKNVQKHRGFETQLFWRNDGNWKIRLVLSSYTLRDGSQGNDGYPDGLSDCSRCIGTSCGSCVTVKYSKAHDSNACGYTVYQNGNDGAWNHGIYTRVHRDLSVIKAMRQWMGLPTGLSNEQLGLPAQCREGWPQ